MALKKIKYIIGIDEVGRGPLAGNVTVAAVAMAKKLKLKTRNLKLRDSKKLTSRQREIWFSCIKKELCLPYAVASVSPRAIDKINISEAANLAASRAFNKLILKLKKPASLEGSRIFLDGGLFLQSSKLKIWDLKPKTIIKGDEKIPAISLASIVAKVSRDRQMKNLSKKYPQYGLEKHKGYGTKEHFKAIKKHGPSKIHRLTFLKKMR